MTPLSAKELTPARIGAADQEAAVGAQPDELLGRRDDEAGDEIEGRLHRLGQHEVGGERLGRIVGPVGVLARAEAGADGPGRAHHHHLVLGAADLDAAGERGRPDVDQLRCAGCVPCDRPHFWLRYYY